MAIPAIVSLIASQGTRAAVKKYGKKAVETAVKKHKSAKNTDIVLKTGKKPPKPKRPKKQSNKLVDTVVRVAGIQAGIRVAQKNQERKKKKALKKERAKHKKLVGKTKLKRKSTPRTPRKA